MYFEDKNSFGICVQESFLQPPGMLGSLKNLREQWAHDKFQADKWKQGLQLINQSLSETPFGEHKLHDESTDFRLNEPAATRISSP